MTHQSFLRCKILEMCHLYSGLDCAKSLVFSITAKLDWSRITWPPRASWLRQGVLKFIIVASRFVDGSDKRDRRKFNFEEKKDGIKFGVTERLNFNCLNQIKQWNFSGKWLFISIRLKNWNRMVSASKKIQKRPNIYNKKKFALRFREYCWINLSTSSRGLFSNIHWAWGTSLLNNYKRLHGRHI